MALFGRQLTQPKIWYINRKSITKAMFIGTFFGLMPIPLHTFLIIFAVLLFRVNLPLSLAMSWISNPLTIVPIIYLSFWTGAQIFQVKMIDQTMLMGVLHQVAHYITHFGQGHIDFSLAKILMVGMITVAFIGALILSILTHLFWRYSVKKAWRKRKRKMALQSNTALTPNSANPYSE